MVDFKENVYDDGYGFNIIFYFIRNFQILWIDLNIRGSMMDFTWKEIIMFLIVLVIINLLVYGVVSNYMYSDAFTAKMCRIIRKHAYLYNQVGMRWGYDGNTTEALMKKNRCE